LRRFTRQCGLFQKKRPKPPMLDIPFNSIILTRLKMHSDPKEPRLPVCHYNTALSRLQDYRPKLWPEISAVQLTRLPAYGLLISCRYMGAARLQLGVKLLHTSTLQSLAVAVYQTACTLRLGCCSAAFFNECQIFCVKLGSCMMRP
jgi:hypothetical protein